MTDIESFIDNEEEVVRKLVLPELHRHGFVAQELTYERNFSLRLGRNTLVLSSTSRKSRVARARYDILITRDSRPLCVVEVKGTEETLTDEDRDQAICYARLVHPVAPIAIVTNGRTWRWFHAISKDEISPGQLRDSDLTPALPDGVYEEALEHFVSLDSKNLARICSKQRARTISLLTGSILRALPVYDRDLYVRSKGVDESLDQFLKSDHKLFLLAARSGGGKTCWCCHTAERISEAGNPTFFFRGRDIPGGVVEALSDELSFAGSEQLSAPQAVRRLARIFKHQWSVIIDGLDELPEPSNFLDTALRQLEACNGRVIATVKDTQLTTLLSPRANPSLAANYLQNRSPVYLGARPWDEFSEMCVRFGERYKWHGRMSSFLQETLRQSPHELHIAIRLAAALKLDALSMQVPELHQEVLDARIKKLSSPARGLQLLAQIAKRMWDESKETLELADLSELGISLSDRTMDELRSLGLLWYSSDGSWSGVRFERDAFRNQILAFHVHRLQDHEPEPVSRLFEGAASSPVRLSLRDYYYPWAPTEHQDVIDRGLRKEAFLTLQGFTAALRQTFQATRYNDETPAMRAFVGIDEGHIYTHSYEDETVWSPGVTLFINRFGQHAGPMFRHHGWAYGQRKFVARWWRDEAIGPSRAHRRVRADYKDEVKAFLENGGIIDSDRALVEERFAFSATEAFGEFRTKTSAKEVIAKPVSDTVAQLLVGYHTNLYLARLLEERRASGEVPEFWIGPVQTFSVVFSAEDRAAARRYAERVVAATGDVFAALPVGGQEVSAALADAFQFGRLVNDKGWDLSNIASIPLASALVQSQKAWHQPPFEATEEVLDELVSAVVGFMERCIRAYEHTRDKHLAGDVLDLVRERDGNFGFLVSTTVPRLSGAPVVYEVLCPVGAARVVTYPVDESMHMDKVVTFGGHSYRVVGANIRYPFENPNYLAYETKGVFRPAVRSWVYSRLFERLEQAEDHVLESIAPLFFPISADPVPGTRFDG